MVRACALLAVAIALALPAAASAAGFEPISAKAAQGFKLQRHGFGAVSYGRVNQLQQTYPAASVAQVLGDANRPTTGVQGHPALTRLGSRLSSGYSWDQGDNNVSYWIPQGITGSADANPSGMVAGRRVQLVSWYSNDGKGVRFSFSDLGAGPRYRHVLAVQPTGGAGYKRVPVHAGGVAWLGHYLYVVDTDNGMRVFDTDRILRVKKAQLEQAGGYRYLLPQVGNYRSAGSSLRFSYVSVDRHAYTRAPTLVIGEYSTSPHARILSWPVNGATNLIAKRRSASAGWRSPVDRIQGATTLRGRVIGSSSRKGGYLYVGRPGKKTRRFGWGRSCEDLYFDGTSGELFSLTEKQGNRTVFGVKASSLGL